VEIQGQIQEHGAGIGNLGIDPKGADELSGWAVKFKSQMEDIFNAITNTNVWKSMLTSGEKVFNTILDKGKSFFSSFKGIFTSLGEAWTDTIKDRGPEFDNAFSELIIGAGDIINSRIKFLVAPFEGFFSGVDTALKERAPELTNSFSDIMLPLVEFIGKTFQEISIPIDRFTEDFKLGFSDLGITVTNFITDVLTGVATHMPDIMGNLNVLKDGFISTFSQISSIVGQMWNDFTRSIRDTWDKYGKGISDEIGKFIVNITDHFKKIWTDILEPVIKPFLEEFKRAWDESLKPAVDNVMNFIGKLIQGALQLYNGFIVPIMGYLRDQLAPIFRQVFTIIGGVVNTTFRLIGDLISSASRYFSGLIDFISGVFTGNWRRAWEGIRDMFGGIFGSIGALVKAPINLIITGINSFLAGINHIKIPDWVPGIGGRGFHMPRLPLLANGGYVRANSPQPVIIGDNKREGEIVAPESKIDQAVARGIERANIGNGSPKEYVIVLDVRYEDGRRIIKKINDVTKEEGEVLLIQ
jgi:phage-related protein